MKGASDWEIRDMNSPVLASDAMCDFRQSIQPV